MRESLQQLVLLLHQLLPLCALRDHFTLEDNTLLEAEVPRNRLNHKILKVTLGQLTDQLAQI